MTKRCWGGDVTWPHWFSWRCLYSANVKGKESFLKFCFGEKEGMEWGKERGRNLKKHHDLVAFCPYILHPAIRSKKEEVSFVFVIIIFNLAEVNHIQTTSLAIVILSCISNLGETQHVGIRPRAGNLEKEAMALVGGVWEQRRKNTDFSHLEVSWRLPTSTGCGCHLSQTLERSHSVLWVCTMPTSLCSLCVPP